METKQKKTRKPSTFRHWFQAAFFALTNGYALGFAKGKIFTGENKALCVPGLNCYSCPGALNACPIGSLQAVLNSRNFTVSCYVFGFIMVVGALFGRLVCGFLCPFGLVQDLLYKIPFVKKVKNLPGHKYLRWLRYVVLVVFVLLLSGLIVNDAGAGKPWFCEYICPSGTLFAGIPLVLMNPALQASIGWRFFLKVAILLVILLLSIGSYRPFCKYLCPLGALYGLCNPISFYRYQVDKDKCVGCGKCRQACNMDIPVWEKPNSTECIRCGECKAACPTHAITSTWDTLKASVIRDLPADQMPAEKETSAEKKARLKSIAPDEKKNGFRVFLGVVLAILGVVGVVYCGYLILMFVVNLFMDTAAESMDFIHIIAIWGSGFIMLVAFALACNGGKLLVQNRGRHTASVRALRMLLPAVALLAVVYLLQDVVEANALIAIVCLPLTWVLAGIWVLLLLSCLLKKKQKDDGDAA